MAPILPMRIGASGLIRVVSSREPSLQTCRSCSRQNLSSPSTLKQPECWGLRCRNRSWPAPTRSSNEALEMRLTEEQRLLRDTARDVAQHLLMPHAAEWDRESPFPQE